MKKYVYADNAATTQLDAGAFEAMKPYLLNEYGNPSQPYSFSRATKKALLDARVSIADCIGAHADEIFFTSGGTESDNWAVKCGCGDGDIITTAIEHHAVLRSCENYFDRQRVYYVLPNNSGEITPQSVEDVITEKTRFISIMTANNEIGTIQPIAQISRICKTNGILLHTDAVQAVGHLPLKVDELGVDIPCSENSALKDIEKTEAVRTVIAKEPFVNHISGVPVNVPTKSVPKYTWRQYCEDGEPYGISPLDFESADEYDAALQSAKSAADESPVIECVKPHKDPQKAKPQEIKNLWRKYCSDGSPFGLNPQDFDSADDYEDAVAEAKRTMGTNQDNQA